MMFIALTAILVCFIQEFALATPVAPYGAFKSGCGVNQLPNVLLLPPTPFCMNETANTLEFFNVEGVNYTSLYMECSETVGFQFFSGPDCHEGTASSVFTTPQCVKLYNGIPNDEITMFCSTDPIVTSLPTVPSTLITSLPTAQSTTQPSLPVATSCPVRCGQYVGDPHLVRSNVNCDGSLVHLPVVHCTGIHTQLVFASSPLWTILVDQDFSTYGPQAPSSVYAVELVSSYNPAVRLRFDANQMSSSAFGFNVVNSGPSSVVTFVGSDLVLHIDRYTWNSNGLKTMFSIHVCTSEALDGVLVNGCAPGDLLSSPVIRHPECAGFPQPWMDNCDIDLENLTEQPDIDAVVIQTQIDLFNSPIYLGEVNLK